MKYILKVEPRHFLVAVAALRQLLDMPDPNHKDMIVVFRQGTKDEVALYLRRNKSSITVRYTY